ncbi:MAG: oligosaccharide flippase family protein [Clostridia bacterium]|nr:oligosaccharide flippase family protein [Clostridia bacterium]
MAKSQRKIGMVLSYGGNLLLVAVNIFLTPFLIKSLGDAEYGVYQMMASFAGYLMLMNFGTGTVMTRYVSLYLGKKDKKGERNFIAMCLIITAGLALIIAILAGVLYIFIDDIYASSLSASQIEKAKLLYLIIVINLIVTLVGQAFQGIVNAYEKFAFNHLWNIGKILTKAALLIILFQFRADSVIIVLVDLFLSVAFTVLYMFYAFVRLQATPKLYKFDREIFTSSAVFSLAMMLQAVVNQVNTRVDTTILGIMVSPESVTQYSVAMQIFSVFTSLSTAAVAIYLPKFTKMVASGHSSGEEITREMIAPSRVQTLVSGAILFGFLVCGRDFIRMWMGEGYESAFTIAVIIMIPMFLVYTIAVAESVLDALQKRLVRSVVLTCVAAANIIISVVLVHFFGEIGAPVGTAIATVVGPLIIMNIYYSKVIGIKMFKLFSGVFKGILPSLILSTAVAMPAVVYIPVSTLGLFIKGGIFVVALVVSLMIFGLNKEEKSLVLKPFRRRKTSVNE